MRDDELREALRLMSEVDVSSETSGPDSRGTRHIVEQIARRRRQRAVGAVVGAVVAVAVAVVVSFSAAGGPMSGQAPAHSPSVDIAPEIPTAPPDSGRQLPQCELGVDVGLSRRAANPDAATSETAISDWALPGEGLQSVTEGKRAYVAFVGGTGVRMVADLQREDDGWHARGLTACVKPREASVITYRDYLNSTESCGPIVRWQGRTYVASVGEPALGPGSILGDAVIPECASLPTPDDKPHQVLGAIQPVTAYSYSGVSPDNQIVLVIDKRPVGYKRVNEESARVAVPSHCGVTSVTVNGQLWLADPPLGGHNPPAGWDENETLGYFVVTGADRAEFYGDGGQRAQFRLAPAGSDDPGTGCE